MPIREHTSDPQPTGTPERAGKLGLEPELSWSRLEGFLAWGWRLAKDACPEAAAGKDGGAGGSVESFRKGQEETSQKFGPDFPWLRAWLPPELIPCSH